MLLLSDIDEIFSCIPIEFIIILKEIELFFHLNIYYGELMLELLEMR